MSKEEEIIVVAPSWLLKSSVHLNKSSRDKRALDTDHSTVNKKCRQGINAKRQMMCKSGIACKQNEQFDKSVSSPTLIKCTRASLHPVCQSAECVSISLYPCPLPMPIFLLSRSPPWDEIVCYTTEFDGTQTMRQICLELWFLSPIFICLVDFLQTVLVRLCCSWERERERVSERESGPADCWAMSLPPDWQSEAGCRVGPQHRTHWNLDSHPGQKAGLQVQGPVCGTPHSSTPAWKLPGTEGDW